MMSKVYIRALCERKETPGQDGEPIRFTASTEGLARDGLIIEAAGWKLDAYRSNPVVLWAHDYLGRNLPIGKTTGLEVDGKRLVADVQFDQADEFARSVERKYRQGYLNAVSVGWNTLQVRPGKNEAPRITEAELLDISAVPVPGDPDALIERQYVALRTLVNDSKRKAIPPHTTDKASEDAAWDGSGEVAKADGAEQLRRMHAWIEDDGDPETKQAYKLPHHNATGEVVWRGVAAAMARLLQAGTQIPDADRRGVYNHLARHYEQFDKEAPEFRAADELDAFGADELRGMFLEGESELFPELFQDITSRVGAVLNKRNRDDLEQAISLIDGVLERAKKEEPQEDDEKQDDDERGQTEELARLLQLKIKLGGL